MKTILVTIFLIASSLTASATHLMSGSMGYEYVGKVNGKFRYKITVYLFRDCANSSVLFDDDAVVGIYNNDSTRSLKTVLTLPKVNEIRTDGIFPCACFANDPTRPNVCSSTGIYSAIIDFDSNASNGYHMLYQRCCRNTQANVSDEEGMSLYGYIADISAGNTSAKLVNNPVLAFCLNDTVDVQLGIYDKNNDSTVCNLIWPTDGGSSTDPKPIPNSILNLPLDLINYNSGYSFQKPLGNSGHASLDSLKLLKLFSKIGGRYAIASEVREYQNGQLMGITSTHWQLMTFVCKNQSEQGTCGPPVYIGNNTSVPSSVFADDYYEIDGGDTLAFNVQFWEHTSYKTEILLHKNIVGTSKSGYFQQTSFNDTVQGKFSWISNANDWQGSPYTLVFEAEKCSCCQSKQAFAIIVVNVISPLAAKTLTADGNTLKAFFNNGKLNIENPENGKGQFMLFDIAGKTILNHQLQAGSASYDVQHLPSGIYLLTTDRGNVVKLLKSE